MQTIETCAVADAAERADGDGEPREEEPVKRDAADDKQCAPGPCGRKTGDDAGPAPKSATPL